MVERPRRVTKAVRAFTIGTLIGAGIPLALDRIAPDRVPDKAQADCLTVENETLNHVYKIMKEPGPEKLHDIFDGAETLEEIRDKYWPYAKNRAEKYGLTLIDSRPHNIREISEASSADQVLAKLNDFTSQYGFSVDIPTEEGVVGEFTYYPLSRESIQLEDLKERANRFLRFFSFIPVELVRLSGMEHMVLVDDFNDVGVAGLADSHTRSIFVEFGSFDMNLTIHEMSHLIDGVICGDAADEDSEFRELNSKGFQYGEGDERWLYKTMVDMYGQINPLEDKATMMVNIVDGLWPQDYNLSPAIKSKFALLLARLETKVPHIVAYLRSLEITQVLPEGRIRIMPLWFE